MKLVDMTISQFTDTLASSSPAPGGGSVAALCGAQGAALCAMVCRLTIGKPKYSQWEGDCLAVLDQAEVIKAKLIEQIDADTEAYNGISAAFSLPKESDADKAARSAAIQAATVVATQVPLDTMVLAHQCIALVALLEGRSNPNTASDLSVAKSSLETALRGAHANVLINTSSIKDVALREDFEARAAALAI